MEEKKEQNKDKIKKFIFFLAFSTNILTNVPCGVIPASTIQIQEEFKVDKSKMGLLGSIVYLGVVRSIFSTFISNKISSKQMILWFLGAQVAFLLLFNFAEDFIVLIIANFAAGFLKIFLVIYFPVWIDLHGMQKKSLWITYLQIGVPLGIFLGYAAATLCNQLHLSKWRYGFIVTSACLFIILICFLFIPNTILEINEQVIKNNNSNQINNSPNQIDNNLLYESQNTLSDHEEKYLKQQKTYCQNLKNLFKRKVFICCSLSLSAIFFVVTNIQFWIKDYLIIQYHKNEQTVFLTYAVVILSGPIVGVIVGGNIVNRYGGYTNPNAIKITTTYGLLASLFGIPFPFISNYYLAVVLLWLLLFFGGALMPCIIGIMISSVPKYLRTFANSSAQTFQNLFGYAPAPFLYGVICDLTGGNNSKYGMIFTMSWSIFGVILLTITYLIKSKSKKYPSNYSIQNQLLNQFEQQQKQEDQDKDEDDVNQSEEIFNQNQEIKENINQNNITNNFRKSELNSSFIAQIFGQTCNNSLMTSIKSKKNKSQIF